MCFTKLLLQADISESLRSKGLEKSQETKMERCNCNVLINSKICLHKVGLDMGLPLLLNLHTCSSPIMRRDGKATVLISNRNYIATM